MAAEQPPGNLEPRENGDSWPVSPKEPLPSGLRLLWYRDDMPLTVPGVVLLSSWL